MAGMRFLTIVRKKGHLWLSPASSNLLGPLGSRLLCAPPILPPHMGTRCCIRKCWDIETCTPVTPKAGNHLVAQKGWHEQHTQVQSISGPQKREIKCRRVRRSLAAGASGEASWGGGMRARSL